MTDKAAPSTTPGPAPRRPAEGDVLGGRWRLEWLLSRIEAGDIFAALNLDLGVRATVFVLARDADGSEIVAGVRRTMHDPDGPYREVATDSSFGVTYVVLTEVAGNWPAGSDRLQAMEAMLAALASIVSGDGNAGPLRSVEWLRERRLAAASAGIAPFASGAPATGEWLPMPADATFQRPPMLSVGSSAPSPAPPLGASARSGGPRGLLWGAAAIGMLLVGAAAWSQLGKPRVASPADENSTIVASPAPPFEAGAQGDLVQALAGGWGLDGDCARPTWLTVVNGRLITQGPAAPIDVGAIERVDAASGEVVVRQPPGDATSYRVTGDTLTVTSGQHPPLVFKRCQRAGDAANAAAAAGEAALIAMAAAGVGATAPPAGPPPIRDEVDVSAFAPDRLRAGATALVQIYLHLVDQADSALARARAADPLASPRGQTTLGLELARGTRVDIMLDAGGLAVDEPIQPVVWRGRPCAAQFAVTAPADAALGARVVTARMLVDGVPLGRLAFSLAVAPPAEPVSADLGLRGEAAKRYARAFLSYSNYDRPEVVKTTQTLAATGIDYFQDILSIEPGEAWRARLFAEIDRCDLFLLFWSSHAAASDWVRQEAEYALGRRRASAEDAPDIRPIILEGPPIPHPPPSLAELHFNDMLRYVVVASELEAKARQARASP